MLFRRRPVAALLALFLLATIVTACGGDPDTNDAGQATTTSPDNNVAVTGRDSLEFRPATLEVPAGHIVVELTTEPAVRHTFVVENADGDELVVEAAAGRTDSGDIRLPAGTYTFYCDVPGHRQAGMEDTLTVEP